MIKHQADDYKTGRAYGQRPPMVIAPHIYPEVRPCLPTSQSPAHFVDDCKKGWAYGQQIVTATIPTRSYTPCRATGDNTPSCADRWQVLQYFLPSGQYKEGIKLSTSHPRSYHCSLA